MGDIWEGNGVKEGLIGCAVTICSSPKVGNALAICLRNACVDEQAASGLAKILAKALAMNSVNGLHPERISPLTSQDLAPDPDASPSNGTGAPVASPPLASAVPGKAG